MSCITTRADVSFFKKPNKLPTEMSFKYLDLKHLKFPKRFLNLEVGQGYLIDAYNNFLVYGEVGIILFYLSIKTKLKQIKPTNEDRQQQQLYLSNNKKAFRNYILVFELL